MSLAHSHVGCGVPPLFTRTSSHDQGKIMPNRIRTFSVACFASLAMAMAFFAVTATIAPFSTAQDKNNKMLRHVVMFKFADASSKDDIQKVVTAFRSLKTSIKEIVAFEYGTDNSPEGLANGFTHCFLITFKSEADREVYLKHEKHLEFVGVLKPHLDKVQVIDYWAMD
jgi:hypothetical protein